MPQSKNKTKKSASGMGTIRKVTKTSKGKEYTYYEARYTVGFDPGTGKQIQRSITGKTQKEVTQKLKAITASIDSGTYKEPCKMTVSEWLDIWVSEYLHNVKPLTEQHYSTMVRQHLKPALGAAKLESLDTHTIQKLYNSLLSSGLSPKTIKISTGYFTLHWNKLLQMIIFEPIPAKDVSYRRSIGQKSILWNRTRLHVYFKKLRLIPIIIYLLLQCLPV